MQPTEPGAHVHLYDFHAIIHSDTPPPVFVDEGKPVGVSTPLADWFIKLFYKEY